MKNMTAKNLFPPGHHDCVLVGQHSTAKSTLCPARSMARTAHHTLIDHALKGCYKKHLKMWSALNLI
jgi:hypothetical protein